MTSQEIRQRLEDIESEMEELREEKEELEGQIPFKWDSNVVEQSIKDAIIREFGTYNNIKVAMLKVNSEYNDEEYSYSPSLILINSKFQEVTHHIDAGQFVPDSDDQYDYYEQNDKQLPVNDITINF